MAGKAGSTFGNSFGEVFPDRVRFNVKKGWFSGAVEEEFAMRHITSIRSETSRSPILGAILVLVGLAFLPGGGGSAIVGIVVGGFGIFLIVGSPSVTISTAGGERRTSVGSPFQAGEAKDYAGAVRRALFSE
jgi:hypothetical protein